MLAVTVMAVWLFGAPPAAGAASWCGTPSASDRTPDAVPGSQFHLVYAIPADGGDAFAQWVGRMVEDQQAVNAWWLAQDPTRAPRLDVHAFGCGSQWEQLDVSSVRLPQLGLFYGEGSLIGDRLRDDLERLGYDGTRKKYVVYYDGPIAVTGFCAQSTGSSVGWGIALVYVQSQQCPLTEDRFRRHVVAHEMVHTLDVPTSSLRIPHLCRDDRDHFCDSDADLMTGLPTRRIGLDNGVVLDYGSDDYYGHGDTWWDAQDSPFLRPTHSANVSVVVTGPGGVVRSSDGSLECPATCSAAIELGKRVTLTAAPEPGRRFAGWGGRCQGVAEGCVIRVDGDVAVSAAFAAVRHSLKIAVARGGRVVLSSGRTCSGTCSVPADHGSVIALTARARSGYRFDGWGGACSGRRASCTLEVAGDRAVRARFRRAS